MENVCGRTRTAVIEDGKLRELYVEDAASGRLRGNIYLGRVENVLPGMQAAFVNIGLDKNAFLYAGDLLPGEDCRFEDRTPDATVPIQKLVKQGQELLVQVIKEPGGTKGPRVSTRLTLPGSLCVLLPTVGDVGVSHRIVPESRRNELREMLSRCLPQGMGGILRTAGDEASEEAIRAEFAALASRWEEIHAASRYVKAPKLIYADGDPVQRILRERLAPNPDALMRVEGEDNYARAQAAAEQVARGLSARVALHTSPMPLFAVYDVDAQTRRALQRKVWLKSGGYLFIDYTEAMTVIDVNTGKYTGKRDFQETVLKVNLEAADEIANQLRLRDVGGIIVIDFIDMATVENREKVLTALREALKRDHTKTNVLGITQLGLVEMTRKKVHTAMNRSLEEPCAHCGGSGYTQTLEWRVIEVIDAIRMRDAASGEQPLLVTCSAALAEALAENGICRNAPVYVLAGGTKQGFELSDCGCEVPSGAKRLPDHRE